MESIIFCLFSNDLIGGTRAATYTENTDMPRSYAIMHVRYSLFYAEGFFPSFCIVLKIFQYSNVRRRDTRSIHNYTVNYNVGITTIRMRWLSFYERV